MDDKTYFDKVDIQPDELYAWSNSTGGVPKTSAASPEMVKNVFEKYADCDVIAFSISSEMSSTYQIMHTFAQEIENANIEVIDSASLSTGIGLQVLFAARLIEQGASFEEVVSKTRAICDKVRAGFIVEDVNWLHKGGRCSALAAFGANMLSLKPCIVVKNGKMGVGKKYRGKFGAVLPKYVADRLGDASDVIKGHIFVTHAGCEESIINSCVEAVKAIAPEAEEHITRAGCTISSHCGRNTLGVLFIRTHALGE